MSKNKYITDLKLEKLLKDNNPKVIRKLRVLNYIRKEQNRMGGVRLKDIRRQWADPNHPLDPERTNLKKSYGYLKQPDIILEELKTEGFIREMEDGIFKLEREGANLVSFRMDKRPKHVRIIAKYLASVDRAFPFPIVEDWDQFLNNNNVNLGDVDFIREANPILDFEARKNTLSYNSNGDIITSTIDHRIKHRIVDVLKKIDISYKTVTRELQNLDHGADYFDGISWSTCNLSYRHRLDGNVESYNNFIPVKIKQYNLKWYLIGLDSIDQNIDDHRPHVLYMGNIINIEWTQEVHFEVNQLTEKLKEVADYWKYCVGLYRLQKREKIEFKIKDGSRHHNKKYMLNDMIHDGFRSNGNLNEDWVVFDFEDDLYYGPEIWRFIRKWGAHNVSGIWPKKLYLDVNEDIVITFSNNSTVKEFSGDSYATEKWKAYQEEVKYLGNMTNSNIDYNGKTYKSAEALFQALRFTDEDIQEEIRNKPSAFLAKAIAAQKNENRTITPGSREDIENMEKVLWLKFSQNTELANKLLSTNNALLIEDVGSRKNRERALLWGAVYQKDGEGNIGSASWHGKNILGKLLMLTREKLQVYYLEL